METVRMVGNSVCPPALKPSLVEWKQRNAEKYARQAMTLETFLGGMETDAASADQKLEAPLKPSLVEWKQQKVENLEKIILALKPSLVEWKQRIGEVIMKYMCP